MPFAPEYNPKPLTHAHGLWRAYVLDKAAAAAIVKASLTTHEVKLSFMDRSGTVIFTERSPFEYNINPLKTVDHLSGVHDIYWSFQSQQLKRMKSWQATARTFTISPYATRGVSARNYYPEVVFRVELDIASDDLKEIAEIRCELVPIS